MIFYQNNKPVLNIIQLSEEDNRTYIIDRVCLLIDKLKDKYLINLYKKTNYLGENVKHCTIFEHEDGVFKIIDWSDRDNPEKMESRNLVKNFKCQYVLKCQYNPQWRCPKLRPYFYFEKTKPKEFYALSQKLIKKNKNKNKNKLYWKGNVHLGRKNLLDSIADFLNFDYLENQVDANKFYEELSNYKLALSLPGLGNSCHREFECFALGTVVVAPLFKNIYHIPLIADFHYVAIYEKDPNHLAKAIKDRVSKICDDEIEFIKNNALTYYKNNISFEESVVWMEHLLEL
jgi:hypothetical protein